jgi:hypothetical protein
MSAPKLWQRLSRLCPRSEDPVAERTIDVSIAERSGSSGELKQRTLDHFVMVRIHARQVVRADELTKDHVFTQNRRAWTLLSFNIDPFRTGGCRMKYSATLTNAPRTHHFCSVSHNTVERITSAGARIVAGRTESCPTEKPLSRPNPPSRGQLAASAQHYIPSEIGLLSR